MIKTLAGCIREYKKQTILTPVFIVFEVMLECAIPFIISRFVNEIKAGCDFSEILKYSLVLIIMAVMSLVFGALAGNTCATASCGFAKNLRKDMFYKIQTYSFENIDKFSTASLVTRLTTDINNVQLAFMMIIRIAIRSPLMMIFAFTMAFIMGGKLAIVFALEIPFLAFGLILIGKKVMPLFKKVFRKYDKLNESVQENVKGMRVVKAYVREDYENKKFAAASDDVRSDFTKAEKILAINNPMMQFCMYCTMIVVLTLGSYLVVTTTGAALDVGQLSSMLTYGFQILSSLMMVSMIIVMITMSGESARRIAEVLNEESSLKNCENPEYTVKDGSIDFDCVSFRYSSKSERDALENIDIHIKSGETVGIIGGTGSSKSTLVQLICRLYDTTDGTVKVGGLDVKKYDIDSLRNQVAVVLQKNILFSGTVKENLRWGNKNATDEELKEACRLSCADEFIDKFPDGYDTYIEQGGANVSGGQKQRLCIARALLKKPKILILDDSTSAVDTKTDAQIRDAMRRYIPDTTKIIIAQRISSVQDSDKIIVMDSGRINAVGTHEELLKNNDIYREVYESQNKGGEGNEQT